MHIQYLATTAALAGSAFAGVLASFSSTSTVTLYPSSSTSTQASTVAAPKSSCTVCPHPKDYDRNWEKDRVLNDTSKHHQSFKLFAYMETDRFPLHLQSNRKDMWSMKFGDPEDPEHNEDQPKWNLHDGGLQTDGSKPIKDKLYFRLFDGKFPKDTEFWTGPVYHDVSTRHPNKATYQKEGNAKLEATKGWSLIRDSKDPRAYVLTGSKPPGNFFMCIDLPEDEEPTTSSPVTDFNALYKPQLVYSESDPKKPLTLPSNSTSFDIKKGCVPITIKVSRCSAIVAHILFRSVHRLTSRRLKSGPTPESRLRSFGALLPTRPATSSIVVARQRLFSLSVFLLFL